MPRYEDSSVPKWWGRYKKKHEDEVEITKSNNYFKDPPWGMLKAKKRQREALEELQEEWNAMDNLRYKSEKEKKKFTSTGFKLNKKHWKK